MCICSASVAVLPPFETQPPFLDLHASGRVQLFVGASGVLYSLLSEVVLRLVDCLDEKTVPSP